MPDQRQQSTDSDLPQEGDRIRFLLHRDGVEATIAWIQRTLRSYRAAVLDKRHFASSGAYRRRFIESYCEFKRWLQSMHAYGANRGARKQ